MIQLGKINSVYWQPKLGETGAVVEGLDDIDQCIRLIITTPRGSLPLRPLFGCDAWQELDAPVNSAIPNICKAVREALTLWEPRITVIAIRAKIDESHITITIEWNAVASAAKRITEVEI
jgi:phage baseplate assembly protein W